MSFLLVLMILAVAVPTVALLAVTFLPTATIEKFWKKPSDAEKSEAREVARRESGE